MNQQAHYNFNRIAEAIEYLTQNFRKQPSLDDVAEKIHVSPFHFQRMFSEWAGVSPKKFLQFLTIDHAKTILKEKGTTLFDAAFETGLSGTGRLHDLFINIEGMTPGEYKNGGENLSINFSFAESPFGNILVASTPKGICYMTFNDDEQQAIFELQQRFPNATYKQITDLIQQNALYIFSHDWSKLDQVKLHLKGTAFQLKVWEALLKIPMGALTTYKTIASGIDNPNALRAVGTAIGQNPVAFIIPCHRVIQSAGTFGNYHWGSHRKRAMIGWEAARTNHAI
jgi:AraC family transcriptional regulator, regulatory protein of adaptative response / methylated-DNA-[protein]-cysteine methyltransferase